MYGLDAILSKIGLNKGAAGVAGAGAKLTPGEQVMARSPQLPDFAANLGADPGSQNKLQMSGTPDAQMNVPVAQRGVLGGPEVNPMSMQDRYYQQKIDHDKRNMKIERGQALQQIMNGLWS